MHFDELDINTPPYTSEDTSLNNNTRYFNWGYCWVVDDDGGERVGCFHNKIDMTYYIRFAHAKAAAKEKMCRADNEDLNSPQNQICKAETGAASGSNADGGIYWTYQ